MPKSGAKGWTTYLAPMSRFSTRVADVPRPPGRFTVHLARRGLEFKGAEAMHPPLTHNFDYN